jgi:hypothetical protein
MAVTFQVRRLALAKLRRLNWHFTPRLFDGVCNRFLCSRGLTGAMADDGFCSRLPASAGSLVLNFPAQLGKL